MRVTRNDNVMNFDVDETLILNDRKPDHKDEDVLLIGMFGQQFAAWPCFEHIQEIKKAKGRGFFVRVWSQGGWEWAEHVIKALGLEDCVDSVECKPKWYFDDLDANEFMTRCYKLPQKAQNSARSTDSTE